MDISDKLSFSTAINNSIIKKVGVIEKFQGKWETLRFSDSKFSNELRHIATTQNIGSSTRIEGNQLDDNEVKHIIENLEISNLETRDEQEVVGYWEVASKLVLNTVPAFLWILFFTIHALGADRTVGVIPFRNDSAENNNWISTGITDTLIAKLSGLDSLILVERERIDQVLATRDGNELGSKECRLLGADLILMGSYSVVENNIRIHLRVFHSESSQVEAKSVFQIKGRLDEILRLEIQMVENFLKAYEFEYSPRQLRHQESKNFDSYFLFIRGKEEYSKGNFSKAIEFFTEAQQINDGFYFSQAHSWEGQSRISLSKVAETGKREEIRQRHVNKFEKDAAEAAPAFYDLGLAYRAMGSPKKAISAFDSYLRWYDTASRPFRWEEPKLFIGKHVIRTEESPYFYEHGKREREQNNFGPSSYTVNHRNWIAEDGKIYYLARSKLFCKDLADGKVNWEEKKLDSMQTIKRNTYLQCPNFMVKRGNRLYFSSLSSIQIIDTKTGDTLRRIKTNAPAQQEGIFYVFDAEKVLLTHYGDKKKGCMVAHHLDSGELLWQKDLPYCGVTAYHNGSLYSAAGETTELLQIEVASGKVSSTHSFEHGIYQLWPGDDHILIRTSPKPQVFNSDTYFRVNYSNHKVTKCQEKIFFSYFYNTLVPKDISEYQIPIMSKGAASYRLFSAMLFYPKTVVRNMDAASKGYEPHLHLPWFRFSGNEHFSWTSDRTLRGYTTEGELLWRKYISGSSSAIDVSGDYVISKSGTRVLQIYSHITTPDTTRYINSFIEKAYAHVSLGEMNEAIGAIATALKNDDGNSKANLCMAELQLQNGNLNEALLHYSRVLKYASPASLEYRTAKSSLRSRIGLKNILPYVDYNGITYHKGILYFVHNRENVRSLARYDIEEESLDLNYYTDFKLFRLHNGSLYFFDYEGTCTHLDLTTGNKRELFFDKPYYEKGVNKIPIYNGSGRRIQFIDKKVVFIAKQPNAEKYYVVARNLEDGKEVWRHPFTGFISLACIKDIMTLVRYDHHLAKECSVIRLDPSSGKEMWRSTYMPYRPGQVTEAGYAYMHGQDLILSFIQPRYNSAYHWRYQETPFYKLDPLSGKQRGKVISRIYSYQVSLDGGMVNLMQTSQWSWGNKIASTLLLNEQWEESEDYTITLADLNNTHPKVLANMAPLKHLAHEFDLSKQVQVLNDTIRNPELRKSFIERYRQKVIKRCTPKNDRDRFTPAGYNSIPHTLGKLLKKDVLTEKEEMFAARQMMCIWEGPEKNSPIRSFRFPMGSYANIAVPCFDMIKGERITIGHYRGTLIGSDLNNDGMRLSSWRQMPKLNMSSSYQDGIIDLFTFDKTFIVHSKGGLFIYDGPQLIRYMKNNIISSNGCFSVDTQSGNLEHAIDADPKTSAILSHELRIIIGVDYGYPEKMNSVHITPQDSGSVLAGALVQSSNFSETMGFSTIGTLPKSFAKGKTASVSFESSNAARFWRIVTRSGGNVRIGDLRFKNVKGAVQKKDHL